MKGKFTTMPQLELVIFDMDGLMFDTERIFRFVYKQFGEKAGYIFPESIFKKITGASSKEIYKALIYTFGKDFPYKEAISYRDKTEHDIIEKNGIPIKYGLMQLLNFLNENNIKTAVASSSKMASVKYNLKKANIKNIDFIISGEDIKDSKPKPEIFLRPCEKLSVDTSRAIVLEDSINGIKAALNANIKPIWVPDLINIPEELKARIFAKADNLLQVIDILKNNFNFTR